MARVAYDDAFLEHDSSPGHPEGAARLVAITDRLRARGLWDRLEPVPFGPAAREQVLACHSERHHAAVAATALRPGWLDPDTHAGPRSYETALLAAGAAIAAADAVIDGPDPRALCLLRPPGHHATPARPMGFCLFNNVAVAVRHLRGRRGIRRVAVVDFDVHHGNGTQDAFADEEEVFYLSLHRWPFYPGTGGPRDPGPAPKATLNVPLPAGTPPERYREALAGGLRILDEFCPEVLVLSAGFDGHRDDPIAGLNLSTGDFGAITREIVTLAERHAEGRILSCLEGGYALRVLGPCVEEHLLALDPGLAP